MKKVITISGLIAILFFSYIILAQSFWGGQTMSPTEVKKKWGSTPFDSKEFRNGSYDVKSKMAYSIMINKKLIGTAGLSSCYWLAI